MVFATFGGAEITPSLFFSQIANQAFGSLYLAFAIFHKQSPFTTVYPSSFGFGGFFHASISFLIFANLALLSPRHLKGFAYNLLYCFSASSTVLPDLSFAVTILSKSSMSFL